MEEDMPTERQMHAAREVVNDLIAGRVKPVVIPACLQEFLADVKFVHGEIAVPLTGSEPVFVSSVDESWRAVYKEIFDIKKELDSLGASRSFIGASQTEQGNASSDIVARLKHANRRHAALCILALEKLMGRAICEHIPLGKDNDMQYDMSVDGGQLFLGAFCLAMLTVKRDSLDASKGEESHDVQRVIAWLKSARQIAESESKSKIRQYSHQEVSATIDMIKEHALRYIRRKGLLGLLAIPTEVISPIGDIVRAQAQVLMRNKGMRRCNIMYGICLKPGCLAYINTIYETIKRFKSAYDALVDRFGKDIFSLMFAIEPSEFSTLKPSYFPALNEAAYIMEERNKAKVLALHGSRGIANLKLGNEPRPYLRRDVEKALDRSGSNVFSLEKHDDIRNQFDWLSNPYLKGTKRTMRLIAHMRAGLSTERTRKRKRDENASDSEELQKHT